MLGLLQNFTSECSQTTILHHLNKIQQSVRGLSETPIFFGLRYYQFSVLGPRGKDGFQIPAVLTEALRCWLLSPIDSPERW